MAGLLDLHLEARVPREEFRGTLPTGVNAHARPACHAAPQKIRASAGVVQLHPSLQVLACTRLRSMHLEHFDGLDLQPGFSDLRQLKVVCCSAYACPTHNFASGNVLNVFEQALVGLTEGLTPCRCCNSWTATSRTCLSGSHSCPDCNNCDSLNVPSHGSSQDGRAARQLCKAFSAG